MLLNYSISPYFIYQNWLSRFSHRVFNPLACILFGLAFSTAVYTSTVFEINLFWGAPLGCIHLETVRPGIFLCTPLTYSYDNCLKKRAHTWRTCPKNVRPAAETCAPSAECTLNHCSILLYLTGILIRITCRGEQSQIY